MLALEAVMDLLLPSNSAAAAEAYEGGNFPGKSRITHLNLSGNALVMLITGADVCVLLPEIVQAIGCSCFVRHI